MRLKALSVKGVGPIKLVELSDLADVVVLAGPNGVGKTNIMNAILTLAREPRQRQDIWFVVGATTEAEKKRWGKAELDTRHPNDAQLLGQSLHRNQKRNKYHSSFLNFDSDRAVRNVQSFNFSWDIANPLLEEMGWDLGFNPLTNRYNDVRHSLFRLVESQRRDIATQAIELRSSGNTTMSLDFPDVLAPFKDAFYQLLAPKRLSEVNVREQEIFYSSPDQSRLSVQTLSSGEREVMNIVFDFLLRGPSDCIVLFDEPELHLHPELSYKLLQTLSRIGERNQFIFSTHSPEIISASLENTVVFVTPPRDETNQAIVVHRDDDTHHALQTLGQSIGVISLGKRLVLIEGNEASLDKQTYGAILKARYPEFILVPVGSKDSIKSFDEIKNNILNKTIWGVDFYLLCDRDAANALGPRALTAAQSERIVQIPRYHIENYFLNPETLVACFMDLEPEGHWLRDLDQVSSKLREIAMTVVPYAVALNVGASIREFIGNVDLMPKGVDKTSSADDLSQAIVLKLNAERERIASGLDAAFVEGMVRQEFERLTSAIQSNSQAWVADIPGRQVLNKFASAAGIQAGRLKQLYLSKANVDQDFSDIIHIFEKFKSTMT